MSNPKLESVASGLKYFETLLKRLFRSHIENNESIKENEREYLLYKLEEEKVWPDDKTKIKLFNELISQEGLSALEEELHYIKKQIDLNRKVTDVKNNQPKSKQSIGSYFYIAAVIATLNYAVNEIEDLEEKPKIIKGLQPLTIRAAEYSRKLKIAPPGINDKKISNEKVLKKSLNAWLLSLKSKAQDERNEYHTRVKLVIRGLLKGIPYVGHAVDALLFGRVE